VNFIKNLFAGKPTVGFPALLLILMGYQPLLAQKSELGLGVGGFSYTGDLSNKYTISDNRPGGLIYYRSNLSEVVSLRYAVSLGILQGSDKNPIDAFAALRDNAFSIFIIEPTATLEYNFLDYKSKNSIIDFSPYFFIGGGFFTFFGQEPSNAEYSTFQPVIPFGVGFKYNLNWHWRLNMEFGARKTFFDYLDNVSGATLPDKNYQYGNPNNKDAYYFVGISLSYAFYPVECPFDYNE